MDAFYLQARGRGRRGYHLGQIVVDPKTDNYVDIDKLGEGDYGAQFAWVSLKLLTNR
jgi:hypothetical protein